MFDKGRWEKVWSESRITLGRGDFGMFTDEGNKRVSTIVKTAVKKYPRYRDRFKYVDSRLGKLAKDSRFGEVGDTVVQENVHMALIPSKADMLYYGREYSSRSCFGPWDLDI